MAIIKTTVTLKMSVMTAVNEKTAFKRVNRNDCMSSSPRDGNVHPLRVYSDSAGISSLKDTT